MNSTHGSASLTALSEGFRQSYLRYEEITSQLHAWAEAFPHLVRVHSIGKSLEGRELWLATIGPDPDRTRPSVWIDANMHATELSGSSVALAIAEDILAMHLDSSSAGLPSHVTDRLREVLFYILPRMSPDGAEAVLTEGRYVRSNPRDRRPASARAKWIAGDINGDGASLLMRKIDATGEFVESSDFAGLLLPRRIEDTGPFYKVYPEGKIESFDGFNVPDPNFLSDNDTDLNRNFPWSWMPEPEQVGAGSYPTSEPEARSVVEFVTAHPEIFAWLNLHTFGGVFIRPLGHQPDKKMDPDDLALFRQIGEWGEALTGYPMVSGYEDFLYEPDKPLHGDLSDFGYHQRGAVAYVCELWDLFKQLGIERKKPFVDHYAKMSRDDLIKLARWDAEHNAGRAMRPWKPFQHPQLGAVEVGGVDGRVGLSNPPYEMLDAICKQHSAMFQRVAALAPALAISKTEVTSVHGSVRRVDVTIENHGYLPTYVLSSALSLPWNEPVFVEVRTTGCTLVSPSEARREVGHLEGWGRGLYGTDSAIYYQRSRGTVSSRTLQWSVNGRGTVHLRVGSCRTGWIEKAIEID